MPDGGYELICLGGAATLTALLTPLSIRLAPVIGAMDIPMDGRRMHTRPMPRCGGLALFLSFLLWIPLCVGAPDGILHFLWGATILFLLGVCDDVFRLPALFKLAVQLLAAGIAVPDVLSPGGTDGIPLVVRKIVAVIWILAVTNAHNMMDGLDGLATGISSVEATALSFSLLLCGNVPYARAGLILVGCCIGYLPFNRHPARVFLGDTGSLFLGYALGVLSLHLPLSPDTPTGLLPPLLMFAVPLSDLCFAVIRRVSRGQSPFAADRGHWHHRLIDAGLGQRQVCFWLTLPATLLGTAAFLLIGEMWQGLAAAVAVLFAAISIAVLSARTARRGEDLLRRHP